eukprot:TRINITY_DN11860_c0_g2_i1.p1 TRINITY_DN11860_c0_g2~~TRINITY_DN11860_c0_g2_i1.p1  ORF type:complete len:463 (-),score=60.40 TRINITY_DN11860_c0_g2_i1:110-1465(-)
MSSADVVDGNKNRNEKSQQIVDQFINQLNQDISIYFQLLTALFLFVSKSKSSVSNDILLSQKEFIYQLLQFISEKQFKFEIAQLISVWLKFVPIQHKTDFKLNSPGFEFFGALYQFENFQNYHFYDFEKSINNIQILLLRLEFAENIGIVPEFCTGIFDQINCIPPGCDLIFSKIFKLLNFQGLHQQVIINNINCNQIEAKNTENYVKQISSICNIVFQKGGILPVPNIWSILSRISNQNELILGIWKLMDDLLLFQNVDQTDEFIIQENFKHILKLNFLQEGADILWEEENISNLVKLILQGYFNYTINDKQLNFEVPFELAEETIAEFAAWSMGEKIFGSILSFLASNRVNCSFEVWQYLVQNKLLHLLPQKSEFFWNPTNSFDFGVNQIEKRIKNFCRDMLKRAVDKKVGIIVGIFQRYVELKGENFVRELYGNEICDCVDMQVQEIS